MRFKADFVGIVFSCHCHARVGLEIDDAGACLLAIRDGGSESMLLQHLLGAGLSGSIDARIADEADVAREGRRALARRHFLRDGINGVLCHCRKSSGSGEKC